MASACVDLQTAVAEILETVKVDENVRTFIQSLMARGGLDELEQRHCQEVPLFRKWLKYRMSAEDKSLVDDDDLKFVATEVLHSLAQREAISGSSGMFYTHAPFIRVVYL